MSRESHSFKLEAVVLRHSDWGEADRIISLFTRQQGKIRAVARGVRKIRSRKAGHLEPFTRVTLQLAKSKDLPIITQAETISAHSEIRSDLLLIGYASYVVEVLDKFTYEEGENIPLYNLLVDTLKRLSAPEEHQDLQLVVRYYELRLLDHMGFRPELFRCVFCGEAIQPEDQYFSAERGGAVCPRCGTGVPGMRPVSLNALRYLRHLQRSSYAEARRAQPSADHYREMETLIQHYLTYILERGLNSPRFIRQVRPDYKP